MNALQELAIAIRLKSLAPFSLMMAISIMSSLALASIPVLAPIAAVGMNVSPAYVGYFISIIYLANMTSTLTSGNFVRRFGAIRWSQVGLGLCATGLMLIASANLPLLLLGGIAIGLGYGPITPASSHILAKTTPKHLIGITFSVRQTGVPLGGLLAGGLMPTLILLFGWQSNALMIGATCLLFALLSQALRAELDNDTEHCPLFSLANFIEPLKLVLSTPPLRELAWVSFLYCSVQMVLTTYLVTYLMVDFHFSLISAGLVLAVTQFSSLGARVLWGYIADRFVAPRIVLGMLGIAMGAMSIATGFMTMAWPLALIIAVNAVFGATAIGWNGVYLAQVARVTPPGLAAVATGGSLFFAFLGGMAGPAILASIVSATASYQYGFMAFGAVASIAGIRLLSTARND